MNRGISRKIVLRMGYAIVVALLVFAAVEAYRIQSSASERDLDLFRRYTREEAAMSDLRRAVWLAGNAVRDYFIDATPLTAKVMKEQIRLLKDDSDKALAALDRSRGLDAAKPGLRQVIDDFWNIVAPLPDYMEKASDAERYAFVQREVGPRRSALYNALRELTVTDLDELQRSEQQFGSGRRAAASRLVLMLTLCVVMAILVAGMSLLHAEHLESVAERQYDQVIEAKRDLEELSARLVDLEEEGRRRMARELHDEIGQALAILQIEVSHANALPDDRLPKMRERLARARELAEQTVQAVRNMSLRLRPALLDDLGLTPAVQWLLEDFMRRSGIACQLQEQGVADHLPDAIKTCVYRVVQEAIHNSEKHASATHIKVRIGQTSGAIIVRVEDDGCGFSPDHRGPGLGIIGMRERAARLGGTLELDSAPGRGTRLVLTLPLKAPAAQAAESPISMRA